MAMMIGLLILSLPMTVMGSTFAEMLADDEECKDLSSGARGAQACESSERPTTPLRYSIEGLNAEVKKLEESARMHLIQRRRTSRRSRGFSRQASRTSLDEQMAHPAPNLHGSTACHASRANTGTSSLTSLAII